jgi:DNA-binding CsgD family transcriptional regulator
MSPGRRCTLHRRAAEALETLREQGRVVAPALLVRLYEGAGEGAGSRVVCYARQAGREALEAAAYDSALAYFRSAGKDPSLSEADRAELAFHEAVPLYALDRFAESAERLSFAFDTFMALGDLDRAVDTAEFVYFPKSGSGLPQEDLWRLQERALAEIGPDSLQAARLLCRLGEEHRESSYALSYRRLARAVELARRYGDRQLEVRALYHLGYLERCHLGYPAMVELAEEGLRIAREIGDSELEIMVGGVLAEWKLLHGEVIEAEKLVAGLLPRAKTLRPKTWVNVLLRVEERLWRHRGDWSGIAQTATAGLAWPHDPDLELMVRRRQGRRAGLTADLLAEMRNNPRARLNPSQVASTGLAAARAARIEGNASHLVSIRALVEQALGQDLTPMARLDGTLALGLLAMLQGDMETLGAVWGETSANFIVNRGSIVLDRMRGLFAGRLGLWADAQRYFDSALEFCRAGGFLPALARTYCDYGEFLFQQGRVMEASDMVERGRRLAEKLGFSWLAQELCTLAEMMEGAAPDGLTPRELEVVSLAVAGHTNKEIAAELFVSIHTVGNHLRHIYEKTGVHNRAELAGYAQRAHLHSPPGRR